MKFSTALPIFLSLGVVLAVDVPSRRQSSPTIPNEGNCISQSKYIGLYNGHFGSVVVTTSCLAQVDAAGSDDIWSIDACVAAATLNGPENIITLNKCQRKGDNSTFPNRPDTSSLNYNIYASIVGDCAWQEGGCPITQQNYVDFVFGQMSAANTSSYPSYDDVVRAFWTPIKTWANTGDSVPYTNFNDWLHFGTNLNSL